MEQRYEFDRIFLYRTIDLILTKGFKFVWQGNLKNNPYVASTDL